MTDIGPVTPAADQDVQFSTKTVDANGTPTTPSLSWALQGPGGVLQVAPDSLSAKLVTPAGDFVATVTVTTLEGVQDVATISRSTQGITTVIGLNATLVPKGGPAPTSMAPSRS